MISPKEYREIFDLTKRIQGIFALTKGRRCKGQGVERVVDDGQVVPSVDSRDPAVEMCNNSFSQKNSFFYIVAKSRLPFPNNWAESGFDSSG